MAGEAAQHRNCGGGPSKSAVLVASAPRVLAHWFPSHPIGARLHAIRGSSIGIPPQPSLLTFNSQPPAIRNNHRQKNPRTNIQFVLWPVLLIEAAIVVDVSIYFAPSTVHLRSVQNLLSSLVLQSTTLNEPSAVN